MFKMWQVFLFSLVPLALVMTGVIIGSMRGIDAEEEIFPTPAPQATSASGGGTSGSPTTPGALRLVARNSLFEPRTLTATAGSSVTVSLDNMDAGVLHNFSVYNDRTLATKIFVGELVTGPAVKDYTFTAPSSSGSFFFRCDVHPDTMTGTFTVR